MTVNFTRVLASDDGIYFCRANNSEGSVYKEFRVGVEKRPQATNVS